MEIASFEDLIRQDSTTMLFGPFGLSLGGPVLSPEQSFRWLQEIVAPYDLDERVPEDVRDYLEVARRLHVYGYFEYRFFTVASERATFAAEFAVRQRFLEWHEGRVPIERGEGDAVESSVVETSDTWNFDSVFRHRRSKRWRLVGNPAFNGGFSAHLEWARTTLDLGDYFAKGRDRETGEERPGRLDALQGLRNLAAHPSIDTRVGPPDSCRSIEFAWHFINALWGVPAEN